MTVDDGRSGVDDRTYSGEAHQVKDLRAAVAPAEVVPIRAKTLASFLEQAAEVLWPHADRSAR